MGTILILCNYSQGLYDFRNELVVELLKNHRVIISLPDKVKTDLFIQEGAEVVETPMNRRGVNPVQDLQLLHNYQKLLKVYKPDLVLTYTIKPNVYGGYACAKAGIPYLATVTGLGSGFEKTGPLLEIIRTLYRNGLSKASCVFFQNRENMEAFRSMHLVSGPYRLVNGSGVNLKKWRALPYPPQGITQFLFVGRMMKEKGIDEFLEAARVLHGNNIQFMLAGFCDEDYQEQLDACEKEGIITQLGYQMDMHPLYERCSAVVMPTYHEGMSNVLMEASACARPVIASNISGCREIFEDGVTGFGFAPKSSQALIDALKEFLTLSQADRAAMGRAARYKMQEEFDRRRVIASYLQEINKILNNKEQKNGET